MIVSHKYKFIFLKTRKTAGTSIEIALSKECGPEDIITPIHPAEDELLRKEFGGRGPQNFTYPKNRYSLRDWAVLALKQKQKTAYNHMPASQVLHLVGPEIWNSYYKFTVARNPWDAAISMYYWRSGESRPSLSEFIASSDLDPLKKNFLIYTLDGKVAVDKICRFENLKEELATVYEHLGIPGPLELPRAKGQSRPDKRPYQEVYGQADADAIAKIFADEINLLGYTF